MVMREGEDVRAGHAAGTDASAPATGQGGEPMRLGHTGPLSIDADGVDPTEGRRTHAARTHRPRPGSGRTA